MRNARRTPRGKTTTTNRVDAAVNDYLLYRPLARGGAAAHYLAAATDVARPAAGVG